MKETLICPYCGSEAKNKVMCCGESSTHFVNIYTVEYDGDIYEFYTEKEAEKFQQNMESIYELPTKKSN